MGGAKHCAVHLLKRTEFFAGAFGRSYHMTTVTHQSQCYTVTQGFY